MVNKFLDLGLLEKIRQATFIQKLIIKVITVVNILIIMMTIKDASRLVRIV